MKKGRVFRLRKRKKRNTFRNEAGEDFIDNTPYYNLLKWMRRENFKHTKKMEPRVFEGFGRGLAAKESIFPGDVIISVPQNLLITPHMVLNSYLGSFIKKCCPEANGEEILSIFVMCEKLKGQSSFWHPYIDTLPKSYLIPVNCKDSAVASLPLTIQNTVLEEKSSIEKSFKNLEKIFSSLENVFPQFHGLLQYELYVWAWSAVNTRTVFMACEGNHCKGESCSYHLAMAPFLDLLNHDFDAPVDAGFNKEKRCFEIISRNHYRKHSQVFTKYGNHSNRKLFHIYGFVLENNINDLVPVFQDDILLAYRHFNGSGLCRIEKFIQQEYSSSCTTFGFGNDGLTWGMDVLLKNLCLDKHAKNFSKMIYGVDLNENEQSKYLKLLRYVISIKLKDYEDLDHENRKSFAEMDTQTQNICDIALDLCLMEKRILLTFLKFIDNYKIEL